jgi:hypothetical protein
MFLAQVVLTYFQFRYTNKQRRWCNFEKKKKTTRHVRIIGIIFVVKRFIWFDPVIILLLKFTTGTPAFNHNIICLLCS